MQLRMVKCVWCGKELPKKDARSWDEKYYCSERCENEADATREKCQKARDEINSAWLNYTCDYVPSSDEINPVGLESQFYWFPDRFLNENIECLRQKYLAFLKRYNKWKHNHCWKKDFWDWDPDTDDSSENDTCDDSEGGWGAAAVGLIVVGGAIWLIWKIIKTVWNWLF